MREGGREGGREGRREGGKERGRDGERERESNGGRAGETKRRKGSEGRKEKKRHRNKVKPLNMMRFPLCISPPCSTLEQLPPPMFNPPWGNFETPDLSVSDVPRVITDRSPRVVEEDLHTSLGGVDPAHQSEVRHRRRCDVVWDYIIITSYQNASR